MKLSGTCRLLFYIDSVNLLGTNVGTVKKNVAWLSTLRKVGVMVNAE
jgi:hypothetical protein